MRLGGSKLDNWLILISSIGLCLMPLRMNISISLMQIGLCISILGILGLVIKNYRQLSLGSRWCYIPLLCLMVCIIVSTDGGIMLAILAMLCYLAARVAREKLLLAFPLMTIGITLGLIISRSASLEFIPNYNITGVALITGAVISYMLNAKIIAIVGLIGLAITGGYEWIATAIIIATTAIAASGRYRAYWLYTIILSGALLLIVGLLEGFSWYSQAWNYITDPTLNERIPYPMHPITLFGYGYTANVDGSSIHNTILIIAEQVGIFGAISFTALYLYSLVRSRLWILILSWLPFIALDNMLWTQLLPWLFVIIGISSIRRDEYVTTQDTVPTQRDMAVTNCHSK